MEVLDTTKLSDKLWEKYFEFHKELISKHYPNLINTSNSWQDFKTFKIFDLKTGEKEELHEYIFYINDNVSGFFEILISPVSTIFRFEMLNDNFTDQSFKIIFKYLLQSLKKTNRLEAFSISYDFRKLKILEKFNPEKVEDYPLTSLEKNKIDIAQYKTWINDFENCFVYRVSFSTKIDDYLFDKYADLVLPICEELFKVNPVLKDIKIEISKSDLKDVFSLGENTYILHYYFFLWNENEEMIGLNSVIILKNDPHTIRCNGGLTCVRKEYRGKNIARYLKSKMILYLLEHYKDFDMITSDTMLWNKYMYRINEELGFKPYKMGARYKFTKEFLENYLNTSTNLTKWP